MEEIELIPIELPDCCYICLHFKLYEDNNQEGRCYLYENTKHIEYPLCYKCRDYQ